MKNLFISKYSSFYYNDKRIIGLNYLHNTFIDIEYVNSSNNIYNFFNIYKKELIKRGFIITKGINENNIRDELLKRISIANRKSNIHFTLIPTMKCNSSCFYCYESSKECSYKFWNEENVSDVINFMNTMRNENRNKSISCNILGGEVLQKAYLPHVEYLFSELRKNKYKKCVHLITNGVELPEFNSILKKYNDVLSSIQLTLDGPKSIHDKYRPNKNGVSSYDNIMKSLNELCKYFIVHLRIHIYKHNVKYLDRLLKNIIKLKDKYPKNIGAYIYPITVFNNNENCDGLCSIRGEETYLLDQCLNILAKMGIDNFKSINIDFPGSESIWRLISGHRYKIRHSFCSANERQYVFGPKGNIFKCWWAIGNKSHSVGDLKTDIDKQKDELWMNRKLDNLDKCMKCKYAFLCSGGCTYKALLTKGDIYKCLCPDFDSIAKILIKFKYKNEGDVYEFTIDKSRSFKKIGAA